ncbi:MAG: hypothetical protein GEV07_30275 [Streptosporangiales bacterium]|nr:hypothetical protein [Streptosporangiales bacterium]
MPPTPQQTSRRGRRLPLDGIGGELIAAAVLLTLGGLSLPLVQGGLDWAMPRVLAYVAVALGVALALRVALSPDLRRPAGRAARPARQPGQRLDVIVFLAAAVCYVVAIPLIGMWLVTLPMLALVSFYLNERKNAATATQSAIVAVVTCLVGYAVFRHVLFVPVPANQWMTAILSPLGL